MSVIVGSPVVDAERLMPVRMHSLAGVIGPAVALVGLSVLIGWKFDIQTLKSVSPGLAMMAPNAAVAFIFAGLSLWALNPRKQPVGKGWRRNLGAFAAAATLTIGLLTLSEYLFRMSLNVNVVILHLISASATFSGQMAPQTAFCIVLSATALFLLNAKGAVASRLSNFLVLGSLLIAFSAILGYCYSVAVFYKPSSYSGMALHTALTFMLLNMGVLIASPRHGFLEVFFRDTPRSIVMRHALPGAMAGAFVLGWLGIQGQRLGLFGLEMGVALLVTSAALVFLITIAWAAKAVDESAEAVTERRVLRAQKYSLPQLLVDNISEYSIIMLDPTGHIASWSSAAERLKGYRPGEIIGKHFSILYVPEDVASGKTEAELEAARRAGRFEDEGWRQRKDGSRFWGNVVITALRDEHGKLLGFGKITRDLTERKRTVDQFSLAMDAAVVGMILVDQRGQIVLINAQVEKLFGYDRSELIGRKIEMLVPDRFRGHHSQFRGDFFVDPKARPMGAGRDLYGLRKDHSEVPIEIGLNPVETAEGKFVLSSVIDVTERKRSNEALRQSEERFRTLANGIQQLCWMANADGWIFWYNQRWYEYTGTTPEQMEGWGWQSVNDPEVLPSVLERWRDSIANGNPFDMIFPLRGADGVFRPFLTRVMPVRDSEGKVVGWSGTNTDITERSRAERELQSSKQVLEKFVEYAPVSLAMFDRNMRYVLASKRWLRDTGLMEENIVGKSHYDLFPELPVHWKEAHQRGLAGETLESEEQWRALDGEQHTIHWEIHPWGDAGLETGGIIVFFDDITDRMRAEIEREEMLAKLTAFNVELEQRVSERTTQLTSWLKEREVLLQEIHHRVKNNLQVISSLINMQLRRIEESTTREALRECQSRVQTIALIHEMLYKSQDYSRIPFLEYARTLAGNIFQSAGLSSGCVILDLAIEGIDLAVDKAIACGLILNELITNSLKHAFPNGRNGTIRVELRSPEPGRVWLSVRDDGVGIPPGLDVSHSASLGLRLICTLAEQLGAELEVTRERGTSIKLIFAAETPDQERPSVSVLAATSQP